MKISLIRHAQSSANEKDIFSGSSETLLSQEGSRTARELAIVMKNEKYEKHFCSPLSRALNTATLIFPDAHITADQRLVERSLGQWEGASKKEMRVRHPSAFLPSGKLHPLFTPPDGEDIPTVASRLLEFIQQQIHEGVLSIVVITHNGVIRTLYTLLENVPIEEAFSEADKNLQIRSYDIEVNILQILQERRLALAEIIRE